MKLFRTLRGFIIGSEPDEEDYFAYSATLRIFGENLDFDEITTKLALQPSMSYRKGERKTPQSPPWQQDAWFYQAPLGESEPLENHIDFLWAKIKDKKDYLLELKTRAKVDVFLGYRSNIDHAGVEIPHTSLEMFTELEIPFGISIVIA
jgi:hypothetical protein